MYQFRVERTTTSLIIQEVCRAISKTLQLDYIRLPSSSESWKTTADEGYDNWNIPNCFGDAGRKNIIILKPNHSRSGFYDCERFYSEVFLAFADYDYWFMFVFKVELVMWECSKILPCILP